MILVRILLIVYFTHATYLYFDRKSYEIFINESTTIYTKIAVITATSSPTTPIQYELHGDTNRTFYLNSVTGELLLLKSVDYETTSMYKLTIEARSSSTIPPSFSKLIIHILNINDNRPEINLIIYPSVLYQSKTIKYDLNTSSTPFATLNVKDLDESTTNLTVNLNDTKHFEIQLIRRNTNNLIYILSTKNNSQLVRHDYYYFSINSCDNDQPSLCTNQSYKFHMKSSDYLCNLSFNQTTYIIDIKENSSYRIFLMDKITNKFCKNMIYSVDDTENFYINSYTGDLFTLKNFNRVEQSIYIIHIFVNNNDKIKIIVRILDRYDHIPFLTKKKLIISRKQFSLIHLFNSTLCRSQTLIENYFQLLTNCTIIPVRKPPPGQYLFTIKLKEQIDYQDTFLLELKEDQERLLTFTSTQWILIIPIIIGILLVLGLMTVLVIIIIKYKWYRFNQFCHVKEVRTS